eukprot:TRINITY_DN6875_c0_g1_i1.p1 TRINITY_DN6875_c0_g1~~TRINITY_DN6875_c0_g1_i1.p1  ORF type:complete len:419 (-),score=61.98 TRINITY_DN6875_c0_g1_i1:98-1354(-)
MNHSSNPFGHHHKSDRALRSQPQFFFTMTSPVSQSAPGITFKVQDVAVGPAQMTVKGNALRDAWQNEVGAVEAMSEEPANTVQVFTKNNLFASVVHLAFYRHLPLCLSPDVIWLTIAQGFAYHVSENAEELRHLFVEHDGKKTIEVERGEFVKGSNANDWTSVFPEFAQKIGEHFKSDDLVSTVECSFSTTTEVDKICSQITLMDSMQSYFEYVMRCGCGIPSITLEGNQDDWKCVREKANALRQFKLDWWIDALDPILAQFESASRGEADPEFWTSICNLYGGSGMRKPITGWLQTFFPYLRTPRAKHGRQTPKPNTPTSMLIRNESLCEWSKSLESESQGDLGGGMGGRSGGKGCGSGVKLEMIPSGISKAPFIYVDRLNGGKRYDMAFVGGLVAVVQDEKTKMLSVKTGWAVCDS